MEYRSVSKACFASVGHAWNTKQQGLSYTLPAYGRVALARHALFVFFVLFFDIFTLQQV